MSFYRYKCSCGHEFKRADVTLSQATKDQPCPKCEQPAPRNYTPPGTSTAIGGMDKYGRSGYV
ncbi:MAG: hypothetical protein GY881_02890 [Gammaproteobacteria bacterium]|nr:hypothetical protein [Gammaproteobacteria bacterium]